MWLFYAMRIVALTYLMHTYGIMAHTCLHGCRHKGSLSELGSQFGLGKSRETHVYHQRQVILSHP